MATYSPGARKRCPHCLTVVRFERVTDGESVIEGTKEYIRSTFVNCPECGRLVVSLEIGKWLSKPNGQFRTEREHIVWPLQSARPPVPSEVPAHIAADYNEAALVLVLSTKASAALSRRCLQAVLREAGGAKQHDLSKQIDDVMTRLPSYISENVDAIRNIGNFAAHPLKDTASDQIIDVEPGEAEWNLDVLDQLFDFYYVQPALAKKKRDDLNAKLAAVSKPPMK